LCIFLEPYVAPKKDDAAAQVVTTTATSAPIVAVAIEAPSSAKANEVPATGDKPELPIVVDLVASSNIQDATSMQVKESMKKHEVDALPEGKIKPFYFLKSS